MSKVNFGKFVRDTRLSLKNPLGLREFARMVGISATYISKMEVGDYMPPSEDKIKKMAEVLQIDKDELLARAGKISSDLQDIITAKPALYAAFLRKAKDKHVKEFLENHDNE
jgi:transcriptional regulator with XRE-family HTH domain